MKLRCFCTLILTISMLHIASAVEVYNKNGSTLELFGSFNGGHYLSPDENKKGDRSFLRYGLIGKTCLSDTVVGFGMWEDEVNFQYIEGNNNIKDNFVRLGYAGVQYGIFGTIDYGRNYGLLYDVGAWTDVMPEFGGDTSLVDNFLSSRASNVVTYRNANFFGLVNGLDFAVQYQGKNDESQTSGRTVKEANGIGYGVSASYSFDNGVSTAAAYTNNNRTVGQKTLVNAADNYSGNDKVEAYSIGLKYDNNNIYLAALYGEVKNMIPFGVFEDSFNTDRVYGFVDKAKNVELVAQYCFDFGLRPSIGYLHSKASDMINGYDCYLKKYIEVGSIYNVHKNISTTMDYRINLLKKNDFTNAAQISTDNIFAFGMVYTF
ncbi:porin [Blochmannia endosymbiont of Polyrhachis (Hedomyrma) turneri]|uniref:porin n=1 Tax=Blochmannia endosymbiont of Polyrhachis (Hedomyrma) turneri TaxID=1505596 RepID=UPI00061A76BC|nr:porin [Blochmannia endosymbiont of Polyrhachis (Hedomyrma) turneri]AKC60037.1 outer membrane protein C [Blochmannia endosymbiont of Polyrhachis (Hedomyrma) turneri]